MRSHCVWFSTLLASLVALAAIAHAQAPKPKGESIEARLDRLEKQLAEIQKRLEQNGGSANVADRASDRAERALLEKLNKPAKNFEFFEAPLTEVITRIKEDHEIPIVLDERSFADAAIGTDTLITKSLRGITFRSALNSLLRDHGLDWVIENETLCIVSEASAAQRTTKRLYVVRDLVPASGDKSFAELTKLIRDTIQPDSWRVEDPPREAEKRDAKPRPGSIGISPTNGAIVVVHNRRAHEEIASLLESLRSNSKPDPDKKPSR